MDNKKNTPIDRENIQEKYKWDLESMYANNEAWEEDFEKVKVLVKEISKYKGKTVESSSKLLEVLKLKDDLYRKISNVLVYARMRLDEDSRKSTYQALTDRATNLYVLVNSETSFIVPEILSLEEDDLEKYMQEEEGLKLYEHYLEDVLRGKNHVLSQKEEALLAEIGEMASTQKLFLCYDADMKFPL